MGKKNLEITPDRSRSFIMPPHLDDWISPVHPARYINEYVDRLNLEKLGFQKRKSGTGRPKYSNSMMLKIWLYAYFNNVRSFRAVERMLHNDLGMIWLTGMNYPDHNTIWSFYTINKKCIKGVYSESVKVAAKMGLVGLVYAAIDGTKIAADVSSRNTVTRTKLDDVLSRLEEIADEKTNEFTKTGSNNRCHAYKLPFKYSNKEHLREQILAAKQKWMRMKQIS